MQAQRTRSHRLRFMIAVGAIFGAAAIFGGAAPLAVAQNSSLAQRENAEADGPVTNQRPADQAERLPAPPRWQPTMANGSWTTLPVLPRRQIQEHDIVSVRVDILSRMTADGEMQRRKDSTYDAQLKDWIVLEGLRAIRPDPQSQGDQRIRGQLQSKYRSLGELETRESLAFNVACEVADILPNGNLILEGRTKVIVNEEMWTVMLSGICRPDAIGPNNVILSRDVAQLDIHKAETGSVAAGYQRGWFQKIFDLIQPF